MAVTQAVGTDLPGILGRQISTEQAVNVFGLAAGAFGGIAGLIAARRLQGVTGDIQVGILAVPILVAGVSTVVGAFLLPTGP